jgi:Tfp pilus assembly protein PilV
MTSKHPRFASAVTLTETLVAMVVLVIAALGGLASQYLAARHSQIARAQIIGTRTAQLLLEDWKSTGGSENYDPSTLGLGFSAVTAFSSAAGATTDTAVYSITVDNVPMQVSLQWIDRPNNPDYDDQAAKVTLRQISVTVSFDQAENIAPVILTTYVRIDTS